jgi:hypothetical protein
LIIGDYLDIEIWLLKFDLWQYGLFVAALGIGYETQIS